MAEPISIQQLKDASEDAITLADFIYKPANAMIPRRLAADINSLQYYLDYMSSYAQHSYETYDEMFANAVNLPSGVSAFVTNDLDAAKNGIYTYNGTSFVKGDYQPENVAKDFVEAKLGGLQVFDGKIRSQDVSTVGGGTQDVKNTEFRNELDALPFVDGLLPTTKSTYLNTAIGAVNRTLHEKLEDAVSVKDFGAKGDGVTDDTTAIQKAVDYVFTRTTQVNLSGGWNSGGGVVCFPAGVYIISNTIRAKGNVSFQGEYVFSSAIKGEGLEYAITNRVEGEDGTPHKAINVCDMTFIGSGVYFLGNYYSKMIDVAFFNVRNAATPRTALLLQLMVGQYYERVKIFNCDTGVLLSGNAGNGPCTTTYFKSIWASQCTTGLLCDFSKNDLLTTKISESIFEYNTTGITLSGKITGLDIEDIHFEQNGQSIAGYLEPTSVIGMRRLWSDAGDFNFYSTGAAVGDRFKLKLASIDVGASIFFQPNVMVDITEEDSHLKYISLPDTVNRYDATGKQIGSHNRGADVYNGDGAMYRYIPHGLKGVPAFFQVNASSEGAGNADILYVAADATNLIVVFKNAPAVGISNMRFTWEAEL